VRGEVIMSKKSFDAYNAQLAAQNLAPLANPRNAASGSLRMKDPKEVGRRSLDAFLYHVSFFITDDGWKMSDEGKEKAQISRHLSDDNLLATHSGSLELLWNLGFRSPQKEKRVVKGIQPVIDYCLEFEAGRDGSALRDRWHGGKSE
jgi:DNA ligase (NAD+)